MDRQYFHDRLPDKLVERVETSRDQRRFRRRTVLTKGNDRWQLVCCAVEGFLSGESVPDPVPVRRYPQAILCEDFLTGTECLRFANDLHAGHVRFFDDIELKRVENIQWSVEMVPVNNDYMARAGHVIALQFTQSGTRASVRTLLAPDPPYYPDIDAAARDWLPFPVYHGHSDSRNDQVVFLLPEARAFIAEAVPSGNGTIEITVAGTHTHALPLLIKGAYWQGKAMGQLHALIRESRAILAVPGDADRLEYYLIDSSGNVYDFHREDQYSRLEPGKSKLGTVKRTLADQVREACVRDEGLHIEFKPFVAPEQKLGAPDQKTKLREIVATVVAFANTEGGHLYLGIEDDCTISGINSDLRAWINETCGGGPIDDAAIARYLSALKSRIKEVVNGDTSARLAHVRMGDAIVVIIEVPKAPKRPLTIQGDYHLYVRIGSRTRKLSPDQWKHFLADISSPL